MSKKAGRIKTRGDAQAPHVERAELERLLALNSPDPHAILGAHPAARGVVVRALRPDAERVELIVEGEGPRAMSKSHPAGFFEILLEDRAQLFPYLLRVYYPGGSVFTMRDPYAFMPTLGTFDEHLFGEGRHWRLYEKLGAHVRELGSVRGVSFAVWAPGADGLSVVGDFNNWDGRLHQMRRLGVSGVWEIFVPDIGPGALYKYEIHRRGFAPFLKADPYALFSEVPPATSSVVFEPAFQFTDNEWMERRAREDHLRRPLNIYEVHLGSWRRVTEEDGRSLKYRETAPALADYCVEMGFTHVEFLPLKGYPYGGSWGYQVANYYSPTARYGNPDDFRFLVNHLHSRGVGVIMDWVPAHFPKDAWALGRFDGSALYEHADPRLGEHPDWGTYIFNYGRNEVRNFLIANALFWLRECHVDGLRVDAVASMLYLDYSRDAGQWLPNRHGGRENLEAIDFIRELNAVVHHEQPGALMIAEESTSWPLVTKGADQGGLGFDFKWNMGWMHDTIEYFKRDPFVRRYFHNNITFGLTYAWSENFILPFSHDEVVHMKGSMLNKMHGSPQQKFANLRALYAYMWAHPGKKLLFMGGEVGQWREWSEERSLDWHLVEDGGGHAGVKTLVRDLNRILRERPALYELDVEPRGFRWIDVDNALENVVAFMRLSNDGGALICVCNFSAAPRPGYRFGLPEKGTFRLLLNTDSSYYAGGDALTIDSVEAVEQPRHNLPFSAAVDLPPLTTLWFELSKRETVAERSSLGRNTTSADAAATASEAAAPTEAASAPHVEHAAPEREARERKREVRKKAGDAASPSRDAASPLRDEASALGDEAAPGKEHPKTGVDGPGKKKLRRRETEETKLAAGKSTKKPAKRAPKRSPRNKSE
ncbi:MAG TPA: 1,4-alpha-glucan branching protein GlgB [Pyrinomonadaceae bacterium]|nr:1,4-alpha-glucan branching protein GlgB [Pyrinomonadaceae bacterium]